MHFFPLLCISVNNSYIERKQLEGYSTFFETAAKSITNLLLKAKLKNIPDLDVKFQAFLRIPKISEKGFLSHSDRKYKLHHLQVFWRKVLVASGRYKNLKLKTLSFELLVHLKAIS